MIVRISLSIRATTKIKKEFHFIGPNNPWAAGPAHRLLSPLIPPDFAQSKFPITSVNLLLMERWSIWNRAIPFGDHAEVDKRGPGTFQNKRPESTRSLTCRSICSLIGNRTETGGSGRRRFSNPSNYGFQNLIGSMAELRMPIPARALPAYTLLTIQPNRITLQPTAVSGEDGRFRIPAVPGRGMRATID